MEGKKVESSNSNSLRVLMIPWLAYGHIACYLELAKRLSKRNLSIYFCSTPINLRSIKNKVNEKYTEPIELVELNLPSSPALSPEYHTFNALPPHLALALTDAFRRARPTISSIIETLHPDLIIYDVNQPFTPEIASSLDIPAVQFVTMSAAMMAFVHHILARSGEKFPFPEICPKMMNRLLPRSNAAPSKTIAKGSDIGDAADGPLGTLKQFGNIALFFTFRELEGKYIDYLSSLLGKKIVPVGPIIQELVPNKAENHEILNWLDKKGPSSTVFVSFGSECYLTKEEMSEVAYGLELSNVNFIWVVRFPVGEEIGLEEALPKGFFERVGDKGRIVKGWAPQAEILAHQSTGGFVSHCGLNSVTESMKFGVPIIGMPMQIDQPINARLVAEVGVGVEVGTDGNGEFTREEIAKVITMVVWETADCHVRAKAKEWGEKLRSKGEREIDGVVEELSYLCGREQKK